MNETAEAILVRLGQEGVLFATVDEAAVILRSHRATVGRKCEAGEIPATKSGGRWRIPVSWLREQARIAPFDTAARPRKGAA